MRKILVVILLTSLVLFVACSPMEQPKPASTVAAATPVQNDAMMQAINKDIASMKEMQKQQAVAIKTLTDTLTKLKDTGNSYTRDANDLYNKTHADVASMEKQITEIKSMMTVEQQKIEKASQTIEAISNELDAYNFSRQGNFSMVSGFTVPSGFVVDHTSTLGILNSPQVLLCQTFTIPASSTVLGGVKILVNKTGQPPTPSVGIVPLTSAALPSGTDVVSDSLDTSFMRTDSYNWVWARLGQTVFGPGLYGIMIRPKGGDKDNHVNIAVATNAQLPGQWLFLSTDGGLTWARQMGCAIGYELWGGYAG